MHGPDAVRDKVAELLRWDLPRRIPLLREARQLDQRILPDLDPSRIVSGEKPDQVLTTASRSWIEIINPRKLRTTALNLDENGNQVFRSRWALRIYAWALGTMWEEAIAARDALMSAMTSSLLEYPTLNTTEVGGDTGFLVHIDTLTEEPGIPQRIKDSPKIWCPGALYYQMDDESSLTEASTRPPLGVAEEIIMTNTVVGPSTPFTEESP
jgi:hypothetical protein